MPNGVFLNVQFLRAVAAFIVAFYHLQPMLTGQYHDQPTSHIGAFGVDIFFVISGFVMYVSNRYLDRPALPFLVGRLIRIMPLYWCATLFMVAFYYLGYNPNGLNHFEPYMLLMSMFFVTTLFPDGRYDLILSLGWTLIYELFFYFVFALSFRLRSAKKSFLFLSIFFTALVIVGLVFPGLPVRISYFMSPIIFEFLFGALIALIMIDLDEKGVSLPAWTVWAGVLGIAAGAGFVVASDFLVGGDPTRNGGRAFHWGLPAMMIVAGFVALERCGWIVRNRFLLLVGSASYALYLFHPIIMQGTLKVLSRVIRIEGPAGLIVEVIVALAAAILVAIILHLSIERRILDVGRTVLRRMFLAFWP